MRECERRIVIYERRECHAGVIPNLYRVVQIKPETGQLPRTALDMESLRLIHDLHHTPARDVGPRLPLTMNAGERASVIENEAKRGSVMNTNTREQMADEANRQKAKFADGFDRAADKAEEKVEQAKSYAKEKARDVREVADEASTLVSKAVDRTKEAVSEGIESTKHYIAERDLEQMAGDVTSLIRKHPFQSLFAGIGLGLLIGNTLSRR